MRDYFSVGQVLHAVVMVTNELLKRHGWLSTLTGLDETDIV